MVCLSELEIAFIKLALARLASDEKNVDNYLFINKLNDGLETRGYEYEEEPINANR